MKSTWLIVEDNAADRELLDNVVRKIGVTAFWAWNGREGKALLLEHWPRIDAVLLNLGLPDMRGIELLMWHKTRYPHIPVTVVSGHNDLAQWREVLEAGAVISVPKPYTQVDAMQLLNLLAVNRAQYRRLKRLKSWRTTLCGVIGIAAGAVVASDFGPLVTKIAACVGSASSGIGLLFARDESAAKKKWENHNGVCPDATEGEKPQ